MKQPTPGLKRSESHVPVAEDTFIRHLIVVATLAIALFVLVHLLKTSFGGAGDPVLYCVISDLPISSP